MDFKRVCVLGLGYIGLPTAAMLASKGLAVSGVDICPNLIDRLNRGETHIAESGLDALVRSHVESGRLSASLVPSVADVFVIAVPTPFKENHKPDLRCVEQALLAIAPYLVPGNTLILESTSPVGTTHRIAELLHQVRPDLNIPGYETANASEQLYIAHCPERVLPGQILSELVSNARIIGGLDQPSALKAQQLYQLFSQADILLTDARTAEMAKLTENAFRDVNIAFANELSNICDGLDMNVWELIKLANHHPRVNILQPGPGVGGHCIAVDPWFIVESAPHETRLIRAARAVNDARPEKVLAKVHEALIAKPHAIIACLGLSYKANVDDLRESPAVTIVEKLASQVGNRMFVVEPHINQLPDTLRLAKHLHFVNFEEACQQADLFVILVGHDEFLTLDTQSSEEKIIIDTVGVFQKKPITVSSFPSEISIHASV